MRYRVLPYRQGSKGAKALATALGGKVLKLEGSGYSWKPGDKVINWGNVQQDDGGFPMPIAFNQKAQLKGATNKLFFFRAIAAADLGNIIPRFWTNQSDIPDDAFPIVCRTELAGHSGAGIVIADTRGDLVHAPLYVQYVKKQDEYRIHVGRKNGEAVTISVQRKARRLETPDSEVNWKVRNHQNGFVYVRDGVNPPATVIEVARLAFMATGLDFGAVDVIYNSNKGRAYVLEINTAPGIEGQTVEDYKSFFLSLG